MYPAAKCIIGLKNALLKRRTSISTPAYAANADGVSVTARSMFSDGKSESSCADAKIPSVIRSVTSDPSESETNGASNESISLLPCEKEMYLLDAYSSASPPDGAAKTNAMLLMIITRIAPTRCDFCFISYPYPRDSMYSGTSTIQYAKIVPTSMFVLNSHSSKEIVSHRSLNHPPSPRAMVE